MTRAMIEGNARAYEVLNVHRERLTTRQRIGWIDGARGLSIALMIVSHVGLVYALTPGWFHLYAMRPVAPMFVLLLGMLWRPGLRRRHLQFAVAMIAAQLLAVTLGLGLPNILAVMALGLALMPVAARWPIAALALCVTQVAFWPMPEWWTGYPPGFVLAMMVAGHTIRADGLVRAYGRLGSWLRLEVMGRYPMTFYVGHLVVLFLLTVRPGLTAGRG